MNPTATRRRKQTARGSLTIPTKGDPARPARRQRERVLVVAHADGYLEAFGEKYIDVQFVNRLCVTDGGPSLATMLDEYMELDLPVPHRQLHYPANLRAVGQIERRTLQDEGDRLTDLRLLREIRSVGEALRR